MYSQVLSTCFLMTDLFFFVLGGIVFATVYRADILYDALTKDGATLGSRRTACWVQFAMLIRDICITPFLVPIIATLYRLPSFCLQCIASGSQPLSANPVIAPTRLEIHIPEKGSISFVIHGERSGHQDVQRSQIRVNYLRVIGNNKFWKAVSSKFGNIVVSLAKGLQPFRIATEIIDGSFETSENNPKAV